MSGAYDGVYRDTFDAAVTGGGADDLYTGTYDDTFGAPAGPGGGGTDLSPFKDSYSDAYWNRLPGRGAYTDNYTEYGGTAQPQGGEQSKWRLWLRDDTLQRVALVDVIVNFNAKLRWNDVSSWSLTMRYDDPNVPILITPGTGIELLYGPTTVLSGPMRGYVRDFAQGTNAITFNGVSDDAQLLWANAHPDPVHSASGGIYPQAYDVRAGVLEDVALAYIAANLGPLAPFPRQLRGLTLPTSKHRGPIVAVSARFVPLLTLLKPTLDAAGLALRLTGDASGYHLSVLEPTDATREVQFSRLLGNLSEYHYGLSAPTATTVYVGDNGTGTARAVTVLTNDASEALWGRAEVFVDGSSAQSPQEIIQMAEDALTAGDESFEVKISELGEVKGARFVDDWNIGYKVTVVADDVLATELIRVCDLTLDKDGVTAVPDVTDGNQASVFEDDATFVATETRTLERRVALLETK